MVHYFDVDVAEKEGILPAIIFSHIAYWVRFNEANETNFYDGEYWTYNSKKAFNILFPYASPKQIRSALDKLRDDGLVKVGNYNKSPYDRTLWYTLTEYGRSLVPTRPIERPTNAIRLAPEGQPIPNNIPNNKPDNKHIPQGAKIPPTVEEVREYCDSRMNGIDAEAFIDFYESKGWMVGRNKMKDWKAAVRTWERKHRGEAKKAASTGNPFVDLMMSGELDD